MRDAHPRTTVRRFLWESYPSLRAAIEAAVHHPERVKPVRRTDGRWVLVPA